MIDFLLSVPGKLSVVAANITTLLNRWTQTKADFVDAGVSTRAPAATALTTGTWTDGRAAQLDNIPAALAYLNQLLINPMLKAPTVINAASAYDNIRSHTLASSGVTEVQIGYGATPLTWVTALNISGQGVIKLLSFGAVNDGSGGLKDIRITIDAQVFTFTSVFNGTGNAAVFKGAVYIGVITQAGAIGFDQIPFFSTFKVEVRSSTANGTAGIVHNYHRTG